MNDDFKNVFGLKAMSDAVPGGVRLKYRSNFDAGISVDMFLVNR